MGRALRQLVGVRFSPSLLLLLGLEVQALGSDMVCDAYRRWPVGSHYTSKAPLRVFLRALAMGPCWWSFLLHGWGPDSGAHATSI